MSDDLIYIFINNPLISQNIIGTSVITIFLCKFTNNLPKFKNILNSIIDKEYAICKQTNTERPFNVILKKIYFNVCCLKSYTKTIY